MADFDPNLVTAGLREAGADCCVCGREIELGDATAMCRACGAIHHASCWESQGGCNSYHCVSGQKDRREGGPLLKVSLEDLASAEPLPTRSNSFESSGTDERHPLERRWNRTAVWAFAIALLGIPLFGLITGLVAIIVGCIALISQTSHHKGLWMGVCAIVIGLLDVVGWSYGLYHYLGHSNGFVSLQEFAAPDLASLRELPDRLGRPMRSNVIVKSDMGLTRQGMGSGVILRIDDQEAWIVTNRHVIDSNYSDQTDSAAEDLSSLAEVSIQTVSEFAVPARIEWVAPSGIDLALLTCRLDPEEVAVAHWDKSLSPQIGDEVFAVGNPHGLGWTHSAGQISQVRRQQRGLFTYRVLQSTAALNPGNSGGGLYDQEGRLIGINTLTGDKRFAEGLGFSIALPTLLELLPEPFALPEKFPETQTP